MFAAEFERCLPSAAAEVDICRPAATPPAHPLAPSLEQKNVSPMPSTSELNTEGVKSTPGQGKKTAMNLYFCCSDFGVVKRFCVLRLFIQLIN